MSNAFAMPKCFPVVMVYGIIICEYLLFTTLFLPAYREVV
jgi:hypothetical protein